MAYVAEEQTWRENGRVRSPQGHPHVLVVFPLHTIRTCETVVSLGTGALKK